MALLPARNILDGTALPVTSQMKTALGSLRDYCSDLLGTDSSNKAAARTALGAAASGANADITSMTALSAGGLPDNSVLTADIANAQITGPKLSGNQSGPAPVFGVRAWCTFDGNIAGTNAPTAGGNVTSITRNGVGDYTINFTTAMPNASFCTVCDASTGTAAAQGNDAYPISRTTSSVRIINYPTGVYVDRPAMSVLVIG